MTAEVSVGDETPDASQASFFNFSFMGFVTNKLLHQWKPKKNSLFFWGGGGGGCYKVIIPVY